MKQKKAGLKATNDHSSCEHVDELMDYISKRMTQISSLVPVVRAFNVFLTDEDENAFGGFFTVTYEPTLFIAQVHVYRKVFDLYCSAQDKEAFLRFVDVALCHEIGHCIIWELKGVDDVIEKTASVIGYLLYDIVTHEDSRNNK